jgi:ABC-type transport system involved in multi-copper enzyme maturation permease subunit
VKPSNARIFRLLAFEAVQDGVRRRIVPVIAVFSLLSLMFVNRCACSVDGQTLEQAAVIGFGNVVVFVVLSLWIVVLAGVLASDHLIETLSDGSAALTLSRPVGRGAFALARLTGALAIALGAGVILLGASSLLFHLRADVSLGAAAWGMAVCALGAIVVAAFAMLSSLFLSRIATVLLLFTTVGGVAIFNMLGAEAGGFVGVINHFGPPLASAIVLALAPWVDAPRETADVWNVGLRLTVWAAAGVTTLVVGFRRMEI